MDVWAIGFLNEKVRIFVRSTNPAEIITQMKAGEILAPVRIDDKGGNIRLLGDMTYEVMSD